MPADIFGAVDGPDVRRVAIVIGPADAVVLAVLVDPVPQRIAGQQALRAGLALQHFCATVVLLPLAFYEGFRFDGSSPFYGSLAWLIFINSLGGMALLFLLISRGAATRVAALFFLMPPVAAAMNYVVLDERFTPLKIAGFVVAAVGVYIGTRKPAVRA